MRSILPAVLALFVSGVPAPAQEDGALRRPAAGFALAAPDPAWTLRELGEVAAGSYQLVLVPDRGQGKAQFTVRVAPNGEPADPAAYRDQLLDAVREQPNYRGMEAIERALAGRSAPGFDLVTRIGQEDYRVRQYVVAHEGLRLVLQEHAPLARFDEFAAAFAPLFVGFELIPLEGAAAEESRLRELAARCATVWEWESDWEAAAARARAEGKPLLVHARFYPGFTMSDAVMAGPFMEPAVVELGRAFVPLRLRKEDRSPLHDPAHYGIGPAAFGQSILFTDADGRVLAEEVLPLPATLLATMRRALAAAGIDAPPLPTGDGPDARLARAWRHAEALDADAALAEIEAVLATEEDGDREASPRVQARILRAEVLLGTGRTERAAEEARAAADAARASRDQRAHARFLLGACAYREGDGEAARAHWTALAHELPDEPFAWRAAALLGGTLFEAGLGSGFGWPDPAVLAAVRWQPAAPLEPADAGRAEEQALAWLLAAQRPDGSWPAPAQLDGGREGVDDVFAVASTALAAGALLPRRGEVPAAGPAVERALGYLHSARARSLAQEPPTFFMDYTPWSHAATLDLLAACLEEGFGDEDAARELAAGLVAELASKQKPGGGWSYYLSGDLAGAADPAPHSMSFTTAWVLLALMRTDAAGVAVPSALLRGGLDCLAAMRNGDGGFEYLTAPGRVEADSGAGLPGAAGRGPVCALALLRGEREALPALRRRLELFQAHLGELSAEQGKGLMHAGADTQGSHYLLFDYATAAAAVAVLPEAERAAHRDPLLRAILRARHADGSFRDMPVIGPAAGTALALAAFRSLRPLP